VKNKHDDLQDDFVEFKYTWTVKTTKYIIEISWKDNALVSRIDIGSCELNEKADIFFSQFFFTNW